MNRGRRLAGFTLVELLVAMAISAILLALILQTVMSILNNWDHQRNSIHKNLDARAAIDLLANDLQAIVIRPNQFTTATGTLGAEWLRKDSSNAVQPTGGYLSSPAAWLMFFTIPVDLDPTSSPEGNICAVSYRLGWEDPITTGGKYPLLGLYRTTVPTATTFTSVLGLMGLAGSKGLEETYWSQGTVNTLASANFLIPHIVDFQLIFRATNPDGSTVEIPATSDIRLDNTLTVTPAPSGLQTGAKLSSVDILLTLIDEKTFARLQIVGSAEAQAALVKQGSRTYTRRVTISY